MITPGTRTSEKKLHHRWWEPQHLTSLRALMWTFRVFQWPGDLPMNPLQTVASSVVVSHSPHADVSFPRPWQVPTACEWSVQYVYHSVQKERLWRVPWRLLIKMSHEQTSRPLGSVETRASAKSKPLGCFPCCLPCFPVDLEFMPLCALFHSLL